MDFRYDRPETRRVEAAANGIGSYITENLTGPAALQGLPTGSLVALAALCGLHAGLALAYKHPNEAADLARHAARRFGLHPAARLAYNRLRGLPDDA